MQSDAVYVPRRFILHKIHFVALGSKRVHGLVFTKTPCVDAPCPDTQYGIAASIPRPVRYAHFTRGEIISI